MGPLGSKLVPSRVQIGPKSKVPESPGSRAIKSLDPKAVLGPNGGSNFIKGGFGAHFAPVLRLINTRKVSDTGTINTLGPFPLLFVIGNGHRLVLIMLEWLPKEGLRHVVCV